MGQQRWDREGEHLTNPREREHGKEKQRLWHMDGQESLTMVCKHFLLLRCVLHGKQWPGM